MMKQALLIARVNLRNSASRIGSSLVLVIGILGAVSVLISALAMVRELKETVAGTGHADRVIILGTGATSEAGSSISHESAQQLFTVPGVKKNDRGAPLMVAETVSVVTVGRNSVMNSVQITLRGTSQDVFAVRPAIHLEKGRIFRSGLRELIVGHLAAEQFPELRIGGYVPIRNEDWLVVGEFSSHQDVHDSEIWADVDAVKSFLKKTTFQSATAVLSPDAELQLMKDYFVANPALLTELHRESDYFSAQSGRINRLLITIAYCAGSIMLFGAFLAALNTMYSSVSNRTREVATLQALGFGRIPIVIAYVLESVLLALLGCIGGIVLTWFFFDGYQLSTLLNNNSQVVLRVEIHRDAIVTALLVTSILGVMGGLIPVIKVCGRSIAEGLRVH